MNESIDRLDPVTRQVEEWLGLLDQDTDDASTRAEIIEQLGALAEELQATSEELQVQNQELIEAQDLIRIEHQRFHNLFAASPDGYVVSDRAGVMRLVNDRAAELLGRPVGDLVDHPMSNCLVVEDRAEFRSRLGQLSEAGSIEAWAFRVLGGGRLRQVWATVVLDPSDEEVRWTLRPGETGVGGSPGIPGQLLGAVVHDLRGPLAVVEAGVETLLLRRDRLTEEVQSDVLERVLGASRRAARFVDDIIDLSRALAGERGDITDVRISEVLARLRGTRATGHAVVVEVRPRDLVWRTNEHHLDHVVANLVQNAVDHTDEGTTIRVVVAVEEGMLKIVVSDDGGLLNDNDRRSLDKALAGEGHGLGLAIVSRLVQTHRGSVQHVPLPDGTSFVIRLPSGDGESDGAVSASPHHDPTPSD